MLCDCRVLGLVVAIPPTGPQAPAIFTPGPTTNHRAALITGRSLSVPASTCSSSIIPPQPTRRTSGPRPPGSSCQQAIHQLSNPPVNQSIVVEQSSRLAAPCAQPCLLFQLHRCERTEPGSGDTAPLHSEPLKKSPTSRVDTRGCIASEAPPPGDAGGVPLGLFASFGPPWLQAPGPLTSPACRSRDLHGRQLPRTAQNGCCAS